MPFSTAQFVFALVVSTLTALLVFWHADRHGNRHATAWGVVAFFFGVLAAAVYFSRYYLRRR